MRRSGRLMRPRAAVVHGGAPTDVSGRTPEAVTVDLALRGALKKAEGRMQIVAARCVKKQRRAGANPGQS